MEVGDVDVDVKEDGGSTAEEKERKNRFVLPHIGCRVENMLECAIQGIHDGILCG